jgi:hypothetical protein
MNPTISITNVTSGDGVARVLYTIRIPRDKGESVIHGSAEIDSDIEIPVVENKKS